MKNKILVVGSLNIDYVYKFSSSLKFSKSPDVVCCGGKAINQALSLKRNGFDVDMLSALPNDKASRLTKKFLRKNRINLFDVSRGSLQKSDFSRLFVDKFGNYNVKKRCYTTKYFSKTKIKEYLSIRDDIFCIVTFAKMKKEIFSYLIDYCYNKSILSVFTPCPAWKVSTHNKSDFELLKKVGFVFANKFEALRITGTKDIRDAILTLKNMIVTDGDRGVFYFENGDIKHVSALTPKRLVDTTGAGDVFCGFFLSKYFETQDMTLSVKYGVVASTLKLNKLGSSRGVPKKRIAEKYFKKNCKIARL